VLDYFLIADHGVLVLLPEPPSVENAYRFVKAAFFRKLQQVEEEYGIAELVGEAMSTRAGASRTAPDVLAAVRKKDAALADRLERDLAAFRVKLVVNQTRGVADDGLGAAVVAAWKKFFGLEMEYLGSVGYDDEAWRAVRKRRPVLLERPTCAAASGLSRVAERIAALDGAGSGR
jgi:flagellar biosynthesis protein FlhG